MSINSYYSIITYYGEELNLMTPPAETITSDGKTSTNPLYTIYQTIINNVQTIYGTELANKNIPTFWTTGSNLTYIPSTKSTLTKLETGQSYYFIVRPEATLPISISQFDPVIKTSCSAIDTDCCPKILLDIKDGATEDLSLTESNHSYISVGLNNLIPGNSYLYSIRALDSNWPSFVKPSDGLYTAFSESGLIKSVFRFGSSESDNTNSLPYSLHEGSNKDNKYTVLAFYVAPTGGIYSSTSNPCSIVSESVTIRCNDCIPTDSGRYPIVSFAASPKLVLADTCCAASHPLRVNVSNVVPGRTYQYRLESYTDNVNFTPSTGNISFGANKTGKFQSLINVNNNAISLIKVVLTDSVTNDSFTDFLPITCGSCANQL